MVTLAEISQRTGVSKSTVSKALSGYKTINKETRERIQKVANELGYLPNAAARSLVKKRADTVGVVYEVEFGLRNLFFSAVLEEFRKNSQANGYDVLLLTYNHESGLDYLKHCNSKNVDAVLVVSKGSAPMEEIEKLTNSNLAVVTLDPVHQSINSVYSNPYQGIMLSCQHLYDLGHRKIAYIHGSNYSFIGTERLRAYLDFMKEKNLTPIYMSDYSNESYTFSEGYQTMKKIYHTYGLPEAICSASDLMAFGAITFIQKQGYKVPDDVSVVGFDNVSICEISTPRLTTVAQNYEAIGKAAWDLLDRMLQTDNHKEEPVVIDTFIVERESTKKRETHD